MTTNFNRIIITYGSESGNAKRLARNLSKATHFNSFNLKLVELNHIPLTRLTSKDMVLVVTSTFGDGEPPGNADSFATQLANVESIPAFKFAIFAIGDVAYANFCQFGQFLDTQFDSKGAKRIINRVDADIDYHPFFQQWTKTIAAVIAGDLEIGHQLQLKVSSYSETSPHSAKVISVSQLNAGSSGVYHIEFDISASGMNYRTGDLLYVLPDIKSELLLNLAQWFNNEQVIELFKGKELRLLSKTLLSTLANHSDNSSLKDMLKMSNKIALSDYLYNRDLLDVLKDCGNPGFITPADLSEALTPQAPRAYSIASYGQYNDNKLNPAKVSLCIREVAYEFEGRIHLGTVSHRLCHCKAGDKVSLFIRPNPVFHLKDNSEKPIIMIGAGTGIAPYIGFLQQIEKQQSSPHTLLIFGERHQQQDFLYQTQLEEWLKNGVLNQLVSAFSRDQKQKFYVQDAIIKHGRIIWSLLQSDAIVYVCGSKVNLEKSVTQALMEVAHLHGNLSLEQAQEYISQLSDTERYRRDLY